VVVHSAEQAELNFQREVAGKSFEEIVGAARAAWDAAERTGGSER